MQRLMKKVYNNYNINSLFVRKNIMIIKIKIDNNNNNINFYRSYIR